MLDRVSNKVDFPAMEEEILHFWGDRGIFEASIRQRADAPDYIFYDGPPFATGLPHYGHLLAGTIKDIVPRYWTMRGYRVERRFGWDCHGLPIEALAQEQLGLAGAAAIVERGVDVFNETCRSMVLRYTEEWRKTVTRMGRWVDFDRDYKTMDSTFMETIWWVFKQLWDQGRIYKSHRIMPYSWKLTTPLSNFEAGSNYQEVQDPAITVRLRVTGGAGVPAGEQGVYLLVWTTTPWTLPGNLAVCAGPEISYAAVRERATGTVYIVAEARLPAVFPNAAEVEVIGSFPGSALEGWTYEPLFPYFASQPGAFRVLCDAFVSTEDGTGIVHIAPAYGEDDFRIGKAAGLDLVDPLDAECRFTEPVSEYAGQFCKDADKAIIRRLKDEGKIIRHETIVHNYPFCERTDTPLIYRAIEAWYVRVEDLRDRLVSNNAAVHWVPEHVGRRRFDNWLKEAKDWNISRNRFWGSCIPVWVSEDGKDSICVGSIRELEELSGQRVTDLHKHHVDLITFERDGRRYRRTPEVLDCWFESGSMPYAQHHYPFERKGEEACFFPAHFIAEGLDQTRGWFYTLLVLGTALFDCAPYRNVIVNGLILAADGRKMSKRLKNYPDPNHILHTYGADALRLYMIHSPVVRGEDLCFTEDGVKHALRELLIPLWNAYAFFVTYARVDGWSPSRAADTPPSRHELDRWILSALDHLAADVTRAMDAYDLQAAIRPFVRFIEDLTNWYIRRSRRRFWKSEDDADKAAAYATLYEVLLTFSRIAAPFIPFTSEAIYRNLRTEDLPESVHLCAFPKPAEGRRDDRLERQMDAAMAVVGLGRKVRVQHDLKVRQPLSSIHVVCPDADLRASLEEIQGVIAEELNVREVRVSGDENALAHLKAKPNFRTLGPKLGPAIKSAVTVIQNLSKDSLDDLREGGRVMITAGGKEVEIGLEDVLIDRIPKAGLAVAAEGGLVVGLETTLTPDLIREGLARELVSRIQNLRKTRDYEVTQRIALRYWGGEEIRKAVDAFKDYIAAETLCLSVEADSGAAAAGSHEDINGHAVDIVVDPAG